MITEPEEPIAAECDGLDVKQKGCPDTPCRNKSNYESPRRPLHELELAYQKDRRPDTKDEQFERAK